MIYIYEVFTFIQNACSAHTAAHQKKQTFLLDSQVSENNIKYFNNPAQKIRDNIMKSILQIETQQKIRNL